MEALKDSNDKGNIVRGQTDKNKTITYWLNVRWYLSGDIRYGTISVPKITMYYF
jgi:hypothetical protein